MKDLHIAGYLTHSLSDWDGKVATVVFAQGCNWNCYFCHNRELIPREDTYVSSFQPDDVLDYLFEHREMLDGVVITGGEPTGNVGIFDFICKIKEIGLDVKLDTNGSNPKSLGFLLDMGVLDYVAMDIKTSLIKEKYEKVVGTPVSICDIKSSIHKIMKKAKDYEFRTTITNDASVHGEEDIINICTYLTTVRNAVCNKYVLQYCKPPENSVDEDTMQRYMVLANSAGFIRNVMIRGSYK